MWKRVPTERTRHFTQATRARGKRILAGGEAPLLLSEDGGSTWRTAGPPGVTVIRQSPHQPQQWIAGRQENGAFLSRDDGRTCQRFFETQHAIYDIAFDPTTPDRLAIAGLNLGLYVGTAKRHNGPASKIAFDPDHAGRLYAGLLEESLLRSEDAREQYRAADLRYSSDDKAAELQMNIAAAGALEAGIGTWRRTFRLDPRQSTLSVFDHCDFLTAPPQLSFTEIPLTGARLQASSGDRLYRVQLIATSPPKQRRYELRMIKA